VAYVSLVVLQRVKSASVTVDGTLVASIGKGLLAFAAVSKDDTPDDSIKSASKLLKMRLWEDDNGVKVRVPLAERTP
jgi:D-aminoacyl-tRNA deacylase